MSTERAIPPTPVLSVDKHNGVPKRLVAEAKRAKEMMTSNKTLPDSVPRKKETPKLPPGITRQEFNVAITNLKQLVGNANVEINDKPLVDGWYMEHP